MSEPGVPPAAPPAVRRVRRQILAIVLLAVILPLALVAAEVLFNREEKQLLQQAVSENDLAGEAQAITVAMDRHMLLTADYTAAVLTGGIDGELQKFTADLGSEHATFFRLIGAYQSKVGATSARGRQAQKVWDDHISYHTQLARYVELLSAGLTAEAAKVDSKRVRPAAQVVFRDLDVLEQSGADAKDLLREADRAGGAADIALAALALLFVGVLLGGSLTFRRRLTTTFAKLVAVQAELADQAMTDHMTGLRNFRYLQNRLSEEISRSERAGRPFAVLIFDVDEFKEVNDRFGHLTGDQVLAAIGEATKSVVRGADVVVRYGGDEFVVLAPETSGTAAFPIAQKVREATNTAIDKLVGPIASVSVGIADYPTCGTTVDSILTAADTALYFAKRQGKDRIAYYREPTDYELEEEDLSKLRNRLRFATIGAIRALAASLHRGEAVPSPVSPTTLARIFGSSVGMHGSDLEHLELAAELYDVGKVGVPRRILRKTEPLSNTEMETVRRHPEFGIQILGVAEELKEIAPGILYHHERWDGSGYPRGLKGDEIPLQGRIIAIIDSYTAMRSDRPYGHALGHHEAVEELRRNAGSQFDPGLVEAFVESLAGQALDG